MGLLLNLGRGREDRFEGKVHFVCSFLFLGVAHLLVEDLAGLLVFLEDKFGSGELDVESASGVREGFLLS